jgi:hypothetical protein
MVEHWYYEIENKFPDKRCREMVIMPNHFHCIIENLESWETLSDAHVGAPLCGRPENDDNPENDGTPQYGPDNKKYGATIGVVLHTR